MNTSSPNQIFSLSPVVQPPRREILARLGYRVSKTQLSPEDEQRITANMAEAYELCEFRAYYCKIAIVQRAGSQLTLENGAIINSESFSAFTGGYSSLLVMAASAGITVSTRIAELSAQQKMGKAVIYDALASECTDAALDWTQRYCAQIFKRGGENVSPSRFSPGYGDLVIQTQRIFFDILGLDKRGFTLTPSSLLIPEKSVIGIAAIA